MPDIHVRCKTAKFTTAHVSQHILKCTNVCMRVCVSEQNKSFNQ